MWDQELYFLSNSSNIDDICIESYTLLHQSPLFQIRRLKISLLNVQGSILRFIISQARGYLKN